MPHCAALVTWMSPCMGILRHECLIISCLVRIVSNPSASCHLGHCSVACRTKQCRAKYWIASSLSSDDTRSLQAIHICIIIFGEAHSVSHSSSYTARYSSSSPTVGRRLGDFQELTSSRYFFLKLPFDLDLMNMDFFERRIPQGFSDSCPVFRQRAVFYSWDRLLGMFP